MTGNKGPVVWHERTVGKDDYRVKNGHRAAVVWLTGLSGSGKSTVANLLEKKLFDTGHSTYILDGDNIRHGLNSDLGFSHNDRRENIRRTGEVAKLFADAGMIVIVAFISPFREDRDRVRMLLEPGEFVEVHVNCVLEVCEERDPKGFYRKARAGEIGDFTGVNSPYEEPLKPEIVIDTGTMTAVDSVEHIHSWLVRAGIAKA